MTGPTPVHTPYDGSAEPFTIGLRQLDPADWIEVDDRLEVYLAEKDRLEGEHPSRVFVETPGSRQAQDEVLAMLTQHLPDCFPYIYRIDGDEMCIGADRVVDVTDTSVPPLKRAARLVQEDLVIMQKVDNAWRLTAASLSFPSSWSLTENFNRSMDEIHAPVPGFQAGTRNAELIARMFDNLRVERPVWRLNWSIYGDDQLHHPHAQPYDGAPFADPFAAFVRVERQTLRKLPETGGIIFTIRIFVDPLEALKRHGDGPRLAAGLRRQLQALHGSELDYKGLRLRRDELVNALQQLETAKA